MVTNQANHRLKSMNMYSSEGPERPQTGLESIEEQFFNESGFADQDRPRNIILPNGPSGASL
jgi:hypothetical protein